MPNRPFSLQPDRFAPGILPHGRLGHLVRAAVDSATADRHWANYIDAMGHGFPNEGEFRLFPLIAHLMQDVENAPRAIWLTESVPWAAQRRRKIAAAKAYAAPLLDQADVRVVWTKGTAMAETLYPVPEVRVGSDLDVLCHWDDLPKISDLANANDWTTKYTYFGSRRQGRHRGGEISWFLPDGICLDVGWMPRRSFTFDPFLMDWILARAKHGVSNADPTWLLIETIDHGLSANQVAPIRWVVDGVWLLARHHAEIDWDFFLLVAQRYRLETILLAGLELIGGFSDHIPPLVLEKLRAADHSPLAHDELHARVSLTNLYENVLCVSRYNYLRRAPAADYLAGPPSPLRREGGQSWRLRLGIARRTLGLRAKQNFLPGLIRRQDAPTKG